MQFDNLEFVEATNTVRSTTYSMNCCFGVFFLCICLSVNLQKRYHNLDGYQPVQKSIDRDHVFFALDESDSFFQIKCHLMLIEGQDHARGSLQTIGRCGL